MTVSHPEHSKLESLQWFLAFRSSSVERLEERPAVLRELALPSDGRDEHDVPPLPLLLFLLGEVLHSYSVLEENW